MWTLTSHGNAAIASYPACAMTPVRAFIVRQCCTSGDRTVKKADVWLRLSFGPCELLISVSYSSNAFVRKKHLRIRCAHPNARLGKFSQKSNKLYGPSDGGGIRVLSQIIMLKDLMKAVQETGHLSETPEPWQCFDLIGGTNTGGCEHFFGTFLCGTG